MSDPTKVTSSDTLWSDEIAQVDPSSSLEEKAASGYHFTGKHFEDGKGPYGPEDTGNG